MQKTADTDRTGEYTGDEQCEERDCERVYQ